MPSANELPWLKIHEFLLDVGSARQPRDLCARVIERVSALIPYDQARVYFVNDSGKIYDQVLIGVDPTWSDVYLDYFSRVEGGRYSILTRRGANRHPLARFGGGVYDWTSSDRDQFTLEYIRPQRLRHSAGFGLRDADGLVRSVWMLDRTSPREYNSLEVDMLGVIQPHLDNLHRNLFVRSSTGVRNDEARKALTEREREVAGLLCKGLTPKRISQALALSLPTVNKHIANIHAKLGVSTRQELLLRLLD